MYKVPSKGRVYAIGSRAEAPGPKPSILEKATLVFTAITAAREYLEALFFQAFKLIFDELKVDVRGSGRKNVVEILREELDGISILQQEYLSNNFRDVVFFYRKASVSTRNYFWFEGWTPICARDADSDGTYIYYPKWLMDPEKFLIWLNRKINEHRKIQRQEDEKEPVFKVHKLFEKSGSAYMSVEHSVEAAPNFLDDALDPLTADYIRREVEKSARTNRNDYYFSDEMEDLDKEILSWKNSSDWFRERGLPWKRGWVFHGPPGTGKSTAVKCLAEKHSIPVIMLDLPSFRSNAVLTDAWQEIGEYTPCFLLIEDVDAVFDERRKNKIEGSQVTFDCFLNLISGVNSIDGYFLFLTTNFLNVMDEALATMDDTTGEVTVRPGRIDRAVYFGAVDTGGKRFIAEKILGEYPEVVEEMVASREGGTVVKVIDGKEIEEGEESIAAFQERCIQRAIEEFWKRNGVDGKMT